MPLKRQRVDFRQLGRERGLGACQVDPRALAPGSGTLDASPLLVHFLGPRADLKQFPLCRRLTAASARFWAILEANSGISNRARRWPGEIQSPSSPATSRRNAPTGARTSTRSQRSDLEQSGRGFLPRIRRHDAHDRDDGDQPNRGAAGPPASRRALRLRRNR